MFAAIGTALTILAAPLPLLAQGATIGIYTDQSGSTCSFAGNEPGTITAYVVCRPNLNGVQAIEFAAPVPPCLGAVIEQEILPTGALVIGSVETGISIAFPTCSAIPRAVLKLTILRSGATDPCCAYPIVAHPTTGIISTLNCSGAEVQATGLVSYFNADASCSCVGNSAPSLPGYPNPPDNTEGVTRQPTLSWMSSDVDGNLSEFDLYLGTSPTPPLAVAHLTQPSFQPPLLEPSTRYYWRVVARDALGLETSGATWAFTTRPANSPPYPPGGPNPKDGELDHPLAVTLTWMGYDIDGDSLVYDLYFGSSPTPPPVASDLTTPTYSPPPLSFGTTYYWRVVARDQLGLETSSAVWTFVTRPSNYPPNPPVNIYPANGSTGLPLDVTLRWEASDPEGDPLVYDLYLWLSSDWEPDLPPVATGLTTKSYSATGLAFLRTYHWRIVARDDHGNATPGPEWGFRTRPENYPPATPSSPSPANASTNQPLTATLAWQCSDLDGEPLVYDVYFGNASPPPLAASNVATNSFSPGLLSLSKTYWWRIVARDPRGAQSAGPTWYFSTKANSAPSVPSNPNPPNNGAITLLSPTLTWTATDADGHALTYNVYFGTTSPPPLVASALTEPTYAPGGLEIWQRYYWRVVVSDGLASTSGPLWTFQTVQRGDVDGDGVTTLADASCALHVYVGNTGCAVGGGGGADVDCSSGITPRDARCIHKQVIDGSCAFCDDSGQAPTEAASTPTVAVGAMWEMDDTLNVYLTVAGVGWMESFGFTVSTDYATEFVGAVRRGATSGFEAFEASDVMVGAYTLSGVQAASTMDLVLLRFVRSTSYGHYVIIWGFVDDLAGARTVSFGLGGGGGGLPVLFARFEAVPVDGGVDVRWDLSSDEAIKDFVLYRSEGEPSAAGVISRGPVSPGAGSYLDHSVAAGTTYRYEMVVRTLSGSEFRSPPSTVTTPTGALALGQNHPNPFNPQTVIPYELPRSETAVRVRLRIHDLTGRIVRTLVDEDQAGGPRQAVWDGRDDNGGAVSSGVYFSVLQAGGERRTRKLVLLK